MDIHVVLRHTRHQQTPLPLKQLFHNELGKQIKYNYALVIRTIGLEDDDGGHGGPKNGEEIFFG